MSYCCHGGDNIPLFQQLLFLFRNTRMCPAREGGTEAALCLLIYAHLLYDGRDNVPLLKASHYRFSSGACVRVLPRVEDGQTSAINVRTSSPRHMSPHARASPHPSPSSSPSPPRGVSTAKAREATLNTETRTIVKALQVTFPLSSQRGAGVPGKVPQKWPRHHRCLS